MGQMTKSKDLLEYDYLCGSIDLRLPCVFPLAEDGCWIARIRPAAQNCKQLQSTNLQLEACNYPS